MLLLKQARRVDVVDPDETEKQAIARYAEEHGAMPRGHVVLINTDVPR
jgi:hypothetical protein